MVKNPNHKFSDWTLSGSLATHVGKVQSHEKWKLSSHDHHPVKQTLVQDFKANTRDKGAGERNKERIKEEFCKVKQN